MPYRLKRPCSKPGCPNLNCTVHATQRNETRKRYDSSRGTASQRGYTSSWARFSKAYKAEPDNVLCAIAKRKGRIEPSAHTDHIIPLRHWKGTKYDRCNLQAISKLNHDRKTAQERRGNKRGAPLASYPYVPWTDDLTLDQSHEFIRARDLGPPTLTD